jgi:hypothetical protein
MATEIDYSNIQQVPVTQPSAWKPPRHVFFGGRNRETGEMLEEPIYEHKEYPRMLYKLEGQKIVARTINSDDEFAALGPGWEKTPAAFGHLTAPSFEQAQELKRNPNAFVPAPVRAAKAA